MSEPFVAEIRIVGFNFAPRGWAFCDGQLLAVSQNTALFSLVGTTYGGDGRSTFGLPDLQGRAPMHPGRGPGLTERRLGETGGSATAPLDESRMPSHTHILMASNASTDEEGESTPAGNATGVPEIANAIYGPLNNPVDMASQALPAVGGSQPHNNMQPYLVMNFVIALVGLYPSRS